jgi:hypothetical protein
MFRGGYFCFFIILEFQKLAQQTKLETIEQQVFKRKA